MTVTQHCTSSVLGQQWDDYFLHGERWMSIQQILKRRWRLTLTKWKKIKTRWWAIGPPLHYKKVVNFDRFYYQ